MTSLQTSVKQNANDGGYFINVGDIRSAVLAYVPTAGALTFSTAVWTTYTATGLGIDRSFVQSSLGVAGGALLKDMGKTVVSSLRTFRKVQFVYPAAGLNSTFGVAGSAGTGNVDYLTGYIELGFEGNGTPAPVAHFGR